MTSCTWWNSLSFTIVKRSSINKIIPRKALLYFKYLGAQPVQEGSMQEGSWNKTKCLKIIKQMSYDKIVDSIPEQNQNCESKFLVIWRLKFLYSVLKTWILLNEHSVSNVQMLSRIGLAQGFSNYASLCLWESWDTVWGGMGKPCFSMGPRIPTLQRFFWVP